MDCRSQTTVKSIVVLCVALQQPASVDYSFRSKLLRKCDTTEQTIDFRGFTSQNDDVIIKDAVVKGSGNFNHLGSLTTEDCDSDRIYRHLNPAEGLLQHASFLQKNFFLGELVHDLVFGYVARIMDDSRKNEADRKGILSACLVLHVIVHSSRNIPEKQKTYIGMTNIPKIFMGIDQRRLHLQMKHN